MITLDRNINTKCRDNNTKQKSHLLKIISIGFILVKIVLTVLLFPQNILRPSSNRSLYTLMLDQEVKDRANKAYTFMINARL